MNELLWFVSRAAGLVAMILLSGSLVLGLLTAGRAAPAAAPGFVLAALHRSISLVMVVGVGVHVGTAIAETYVDIGWVSLLVPFTSAYEPLWVGLGTVAVDLLLIIVLTSMLRDRIPTRWWRLVHWTAYAVWPVAVLHEITTSSTDTTAVWVTSLVCLAAVGVAVGWRTRRVTADTRQRAWADAGRWGG